MSTSMFRKSSTSAAGAVAQALALALALPCTPVDATSLLLASGAIDAKARVSRLKAARELLAEFDRFADLVQSPRPTEVAWVEAEQASIAKINNSDDSLARTIQLLSTAEYQQLKVHNHVQEVRNALKCVIDSPATLQREIFCWAAASYLLGDAATLADGTRVLIRAKRLPDDTPTRVGAGTEAGITLLYGLVSRRIQQHLVLPFLRGEIK